MDIEMSTDPYPQTVTSDTDDGTTVTSASPQADATNPDGSGTPVTGGWSPPSK
jgi:hypothetical protein